MIKRHCFATYLFSVWFCACSGGADNTRVDPESHAPDTTTVALAPQPSSGADPGEAAAPEPSYSRGSKRTPSPGSISIPDDRNDTAESVDSDPHDESNRQALDPPSTADAGTPDGASPHTNDAGRVTAPPCHLRVEWSALQPSGADCTSSSALTQTAYAVWDGQVLDLGGELWQPQAGALERMRRCRREPRPLPAGAGTPQPQLWRFSERLVLNGELPLDACPRAPVRATYSYSDCPFVSGGSVCLAGPGTCNVSGEVRLFPVDAAPEDAAALAAPASEASCRPIGRDPPRPVPAGERCYDGECIQGYYCSRELATSCAPIGEGVCTPAPALSECDSTPETSCACGTPAPPLDTLGPFRSGNPSALAPNRCNAHALGISLSACAAE